MMKAVKSFEEILSEKLNNAKNEPQYSSTTRAIIEESVPIFFVNFALKVKSPLGRYPKKTISVSEKLTNWLEKCQTFEEKQAVQFFFSHGEVDFIDDRTLSKSFRRLALKLHPDRFARQNATVVDQKKSQFIELQKHYACLKKLAKLS